MEHSTEMNTRITLYSGQASRRPLALRSRSVRLLSHPKGAWRLWPQQLRAAAGRNTGLPGYLSSRQLRRYSRSDRRRTLQAVRKTTRRVGGQTSRRLASQMPRSQKHPLTRVALAALSDLLIIPAVRRQAGAQLGGRLRWANR